MIERSTEGGRWNATFRPRRRVRTFATTFLALWLVVWAAGEAVALGILLASLDLPGGSRLLRLLTMLAKSVGPGLAERFAWRELPSPQGAGLLALAFIGSWLVVWTLAGLMAAFQVMRLNGSEDRIAWDGTGVELFRRTGPFRSRRSWRSDQIEHLSLSRSDRALLLHTARATVALTEWGSKAERQGVCDEIRKVLRNPSRVTSRPPGQEVPEGWVALAAPPDGTRLLKDPASRSRRAGAVWVFTIGLAGAAAAGYMMGTLDGFLGLGEGMVVVLAAFFVLAGVAGGAWLAFGGTELILREGSLELRRGWLAGGSSETLKRLKLSIEHSTDADGDDWFELQARSGEQRRTLDRGMDESEELIELGRWIAQRTGAPLDIKRGVETDEEQPESMVA